MSIAKELGKYPEYAYPFSYEGVLEKRIDDFALRQQSCDVSEVVRMLLPSEEIPDCGRRMNPSYFRQFYPRPGLGAMYDTIWAGEEATAAHGYPSPKAPGVSLGQMISLRYGEPLLRGGAPTETRWKQPQEYHCPYGWRRFSFEVPDFQRWDKCAVAYHGTELKLVPQILSTCLRPGAAQEGGDGQCTYLTPSIEYAAAPRYAKTLRIDGRFVQAVIQFRVKKPDFIQGETLGATFQPECPGGWASRPWGEQSGGNGRPYPTDYIPYDPHYKNEELEWLFSQKSHDLRDEIMPTGLMIRVLKMDPVDLLLKRQQAAKAARR